ncbi:MAG: hypothetical protein FP813_00060 [Desulfurivibrio sp.]|nr:hypothetical protein [Desulfurivibrio sp.]
MTDNGPDRDFHAEIDDAIDNLFSPQAAAPQPQSASPPSAKQESRAPAASTPTKDESLTASMLSSDGADAFSPFEEALLSLDWEISSSNIDNARSALKDIQGNFDVDKAVALTEIFSLMDRLLEAMAIAPQNVSTSAPKTLQEGLQTLRAAAGAENLSLIEQTLIDPTLSELRSSIPNIPKDYSKLFQTAASKTHGVAGREQKTAAGVKAAPAQAASPAPSGSEEEDLVLELPGASTPAKSVAALIDAVNSHLTILGKCIAKRIVPVENLFAKTPGYEKLHAIHTELRERLERQKQNLIKALGADYQADAAAPVDPPLGQTAQSGSCPWNTVTLGTWGGKTVGFLPDQIVYEDKPAARVRKCGSFLPIKMLKRGLFGKIGFVVQGELSFHDEATLKTLTIPVAKSSGMEESALKTGNPLLILFKENSGLAFWLDEETEQLDTTVGCRWETVSDPHTFVAGNLTAKGKTIPVITLRGV